MKLLRILFGCLFFPFALCITCAPAVKSLTQPSPFAFLSGKWKSVAITDPKKHGPEFGWELTFSPEGQCTILTDAGFRIYTKHVVNFMSENGELSFLSEEKGAAPYIARYDSVGPKLSITAPELYGWTMSFIKTDDSIPEIRRLPRLPRTLRDAVKILYSELSEEDKDNLLFWHYWGLSGLHFGYGMWIQKRFRLFSGNEELVTSCGSSAMLPAEAAEKILEELAKEVRLHADPNVAVCLHLQDRVLQGTFIPTGMIDSKRLSDIGAIINDSIRDRINRDSSYTLIKDFKISLEISRPNDTTFDCTEFTHFFNTHGKKHMANIDQILFAIAGFYGLEEKREVMAIRLFDRGND